MQYGVLFRFSDVSEEELNALIQKAIPGETKIAIKYNINIFKGKTEMNFKYRFDSFTRQ